MWPEVLLSPRGLITILLFFAITDEYVCDQNFHTEIMPGILLFIILGTALTMSNALIGVKKIEQNQKSETEIDNKSVESLYNLNENIDLDNGEEEKEKESFD